MNKTTLTFCITELASIRQQRLLFKNLSLNLQQGDCLVIEGPNGSGKSSLLRILAGLALPTHGDIHWQGTPISTNRHAYYADMHYIGHLNGIKSGLTVTENLHLIIELAGGDSTTNIIPVLASLELQHHHHELARHLSAGQKRRLALAKLFCIKKSLWLLDEPLTALDTATQAIFMKQLEQHLQQGGIAVISTHQTISLQHATIKTLKLPLC